MRRIAHTTPEGIETELPYGGGFIIEKRLAVIDEPGAGLVVQSECLDPKTGQWGAEPWRSGRPRIVSAVIAASNERISRMTEKHNDPRPQAKRHTAAEAAVAMAERRARNA